MSSDTPQPVLYLGDTALTAAAAYLAGVMHHAGIGFDYCPSDTPIDDALRAEERKLVILSDYPASNLTDAQHHEIARGNTSGGGILMIGGWESYHGLSGGWPGSPLAELLPVTMLTRDDRVNHDQAAYLKRVTDHPAVANLPWDERPPAIGGYNRFRAKPAGKVLLEVARRSVCRVGEGFQLASMILDPMLVVAEGNNGQGRVATLATDAAPHWVGPLVDWGTDNDDTPSGHGRVACHAPGANAVEVGQHYARFFTQLVRWTGNLEDKP